MAYETIKIEIDEEVKANIGNESSDNGTSNTKFFPMDGSKPR